MFAPGGSRLGGLDHGMLPPGRPSLEREPRRAKLFLRSVQALVLRLLWIFLALVLLVLLPFLAWGEGFERLFSQPRAVGWLADHGHFAWAAGMLLLVADLFLPIPATAVMAALGILYGPLIGGAIAAGGAFLSGALAYGLCRLYGRPVAKRILKPADLDRGERLFASVGGWLVVLSRWLPILPEVIACMAGLVRMPAGSFFSALACGTLPLGFLFATVGHAGAEEPGLAVGLSAILPLVLWLVVRRRLARRDERSQPRPPSTTSPPRPSSAEPKLPRQ